MYSQFMMHGQKNIKLNSTCTAEVNISWNYHSTPPYAFVVWRLNEHREDKPF